MIRTVLLAVAGTLWLATATEAQSTLHPPARSFEELMAWVRLDDPILVVEASGQETTGRVGMLSTTALTLVVETTRRQFAEDDVKRVDRWRPDSTLNGLMIGAGAGAIAGNGLGRTLDSPTCPRPGIECGQGAVLGTVTGALWGAAGGWLVDALIRKRQVIFLRP